MTEQEQESIAKWIDGMYSDAIKSGRFGRAIVTVVEMQDGRRFRVSIAKTNSADEIHAEAQARTLKYIMGDAP